MGSLYRRGSTWWVKYYRNGKPQRESSGSEKESDARNLLKLREGDVARGVAITPKVGRVKIDELINDVITNYRINRKKSTDNAERRFRLHVLPAFSGWRASTISSSDVEAFVQRRQSVGAKNATINRELSALKRAFSLGLKSGKILSKPYIPMLKEDNVRQGFFDGEKYEAVLRQLPEHLEPLIRFYNITGWRKAEVLTLQWKQVDFEGRSVRLEPGTTKNDAGRVFPFTAELEALLIEQRAKADELQKRGVICPWVFHRNGLRIRSYNNGWRAACKRAGIPGMRIHDFRRTAVRRLERAGVSRSVAMQLTGHKTESVYRRYAIVSEGDLRDAAKRLDAVAGTIAGTVRVLRGGKASDGSL